METNREHRGYTSKPSVELGTTLLELVSLEKTKVVQVNTC